MLTFGGVTRIAVLDCLDGENVADQFNWRYFFTSISEFIPKK